MKKKVPTIGFFSQRLDAYYQVTLWQGVVEQAEESRVKLICFPGERLKASVGFEAQANFVFRMASTANVDGIIMLTPGICPFISKKELLDFCSSFAPIPIVSVGDSLPGMLCAMVDNAMGIRQMIQHMVSVHNVKSFAFIGGRENNRESKCRMDTLAKEIEKHGLVLEKENIIMNGFMEESGIDAVRILFSRKNNRIDAIFAVNDYTANGAIKALKNRGMHVPEDIAVTGFDNTPESAFGIPALTTIHQPIYELGRTALTMIIEHLENKDRDETHADTAARKSSDPLKKIVLPTSIMIRESCGCTGYNILNIKPQEKAVENRLLKHSIKIFKDSIINECSSFFPVPGSPRASAGRRASIARFTRMYLDDLFDVSEDRFIPAVNRLLRESIAGNHDIGSVGSFISALREHTLRYEISKEELVHAVRLWERVQATYNDFVQRVQNIKRLEAERLSRILWQVGNTLIISFNLSRLIEAVKESLVALEIKRCYFSVFEKKDDLKWARLLLAYANGKARKLPKSGIRFISEYLTPISIFPIGDVGPLIVEPLYFRKEQLGFIIFEMSSIDNIVYDAFRRQLSSALKGAYLMEETKNHTQVLAKEVAQRTMELTRTNKQLQEEIALRKKVDSAFKTSEKNLRAITGATPIPLVIFRMNDGRILYSNNPFLVEFGIKDRLNQKRQIQQFFHDTEYFEELLAKLKDAGKLVNIELLAHRLNSASFSVIASFQQLTFRGEIAVLAGMYNITERKRLEKEILEISGREQRRIGQDLHDDLCQDLAGIAVMASALENNLKELDTGTADKAAVISQLINETIVKTRDLARGLFPAILAETSLVYMFEDLAKKIQNQFDIQCKLRIKNKVSVEDNMVALHLYRIAQEAVNNAIRHGKPEVIEILFYTSASEIALIVRDNGKGIPPDYANSKGMGLQIMNYRANLIGGKLDIKRNGISGTSLSCFIKRKK